MRIYYETGKGKEKIYLDQPPYWMQTGDFLDYSWEYELSGKRVGKLRKTVQEKEFTITVFGNTEEQYAKNLNLLHEALEKDILENTPGRFYFGEYYLSCYIFASEKAEWEGFSYSMDNTFRLIQTDPSWIKETTYQFRPQQIPTKEPVLRDPVVSGTPYSGVTIENKAVIKEFPFDFARQSNIKITYPMFGFPFDFVATSYGRRTINNPSFTDSNFILTIYGFADNPSVMIAGHPYTVYATIYEGERMVINSVDRTVLKIGRLGEVTSLYNSREKIISVFQKIPPGAHVVTWPGSYGIDLTLLDERSEPKWSF